MSRGEVELVYELSPMQQAMLFASLYAPGSGVYVVQLGLRLSGRLDLPAFERAWRRVVDRHGALRTGFYWEDLEKPVQVVYREGDLALHRQSWRGLDEAETEARLREFLEADRESGFDLGEPPLMRLALFELGPGSWHLVWTLHHLLVDGWSLGLLLKELFTAYAAFAAGREPALAPARSYRDYIAWLQRQDAAEAEAFWRRSLAGISSPTLMAGGDGRGAAGFRATERQGARLPAETTAALCELARRHRLTMNTLLQGAWALLLAQATGADEAVFGGTVAGRPGGLPGADSIVGLFINTLPVRVGVEGGRPLLPWLSALQEQQAEARHFEHAPLYEIQTWSGLPAGTALFDTLLAFESYPLDGALAGLLPDLSLSRVTTNELTNYPLNLVVIPGDELSLELLHDAGRITAAAATRLLERLAGVLRVFAADPDRRLEDLPLLLEGEREQVLVEWNDTRTAYPREASLPELFAAVAAASSEAPAIVDEDGTVWSYGRLDEASNRLAHHLVGLGVEPGARVGVAMDRSADLLVAVLAIVKAGAAYVPLDPGYPDERLAFMLEDTGAAVVLVHGRTRERLAALEAAGTQVCLARDREVIAARSAVPFPLSVPAEALAYVIYTSGSTGRPKGVAVPHRAIVRLVRDTDYVRLGPGDRTGHVANISFDAATYEIWGALLTGAAAVVIPREVVLSPPDFAARLRDQRVSTMFLTSALFTRMARETPGAFAGMSELLVGGEAVDPLAARTVLADRPPRRLLNGYGPTESTTFAAWHPIREVPPEATNVPIGLPLANTTLWVLDRRVSPVPPEVPGELSIGGDGLAWGYWNRPDLTAERFVPHPWGAGERLYRTGDLVRRRPEGPVEYLGRLDHQVKIRGFRIEPGEVEAVLAGHPEIRECAVLARRDAPGETRLVAYVVGHGKLRGKELRTWLQQRLPEYMLPSAFVVLPTLPLTANGKLDRQALPAPEEVLTTGGESPTAPSDPIEELLAGIWAEVLGRERVGIHDDFFALGGHSLLATKVMSRLRGVLGVELPLRSLFEEPTVAGLAAAAREALQAESVQAPPLVPMSRDGDLPLSFAQQRLWFIDQLDPGNPGYNIPAAVRLTGDLSVSRLKRLFAELVRRHEVLRTTFASRDGRPVQVIHPGLRPELPVVDLSLLSREVQEDAAGRLAIAESLGSFDLQAGPLLRLMLLRLGPAEHLLLVTVHHVVSDGWSMGVLVREVQTLYRAFGRGEVSPLPELPVQYADFAVWQRQWLAGEVLERQLAFWRERLEDSTGVLDLPTDRPRPAVLSLRGGEHRFALDRELSRRIVELGQREGATPFMILAAALLALLSRLSGQKDLNLASPIAGRNRTEIEGLIGFFVNTLVLRADLARVEVFLDLLQQVRDVSLGAYAHQDLPFEKLVDEVQPERDLSRSPLAQVALAVHNMGLPAADVDGLRMTSEDPLAQVAKFDLAFIFAEDRKGCLAGSLQYATDLYDTATAIRLTRQLARFLDELTARPEEPLQDLAFLTESERHQVAVEWNDTAGGFHTGTLMHQLFEARADAQPDAVAAVWESLEWTYRELEDQANRLASLLSNLGVVRGTPVGVWMERSLHMLAAVLGILKAGGTYVPLDATWPAERVETILAAMDVPIIVASHATLPAIEEIRWRLPRLADAVCPDLEAPEPEPEPLDAGSVRSLFDFVAERATDRITAGGFVSSFTGLPFSEAEVDEYRDRVLSLAAPWLHPGARVLEVGCGSGLILREMARRVERSVGLDPSPGTQERNREHARAEGLENLELAVGFAHEIDTLFAEGSFDLIVLTSTVQFFPGPRYLERVVADALRLLAPGGALLVADVMDARRQGELRRALAQAGDTGTTSSHELWLDEDLFHDLGAALPGAGEVEVLHRTEGFANELGYRYDVRLRKGDDTAPREQRRKRLWTGWHIGRASTARPPAVAAPEDIAYVIHTSGSTGAPKGIVVQHVPAVNLIGWINSTFGVEPKDRLLFVTSLCFDLSVYDIFGVLAAGGTVHIAPEATLRDADRLVRLLCHEPITIWDSAPAALQHLAPLFPAQDDRPLRLVMLSGDWIPVRLPDQVRAAFPRAKVMALGGATEATVWSNWFPVGIVDSVWPSIPYGRPITAARYYVLDEGMLPCPIGVPGDLYIGGRCLCVGYAGQPELTAAQFVPDSFAEEPGSRLYRTGDRARFFPDGNLEFLGRVDYQVKVRGYRIELGEVEVSLLRHPDVREAVVTVREDRPGDQALVAYVVPRGTAPETHELRAFLAEMLPSYMVPAAYVILESLPVTPNGKLDRKALPAPERAHTDAGTWEAPSDPVEELMADLFAEVLGLDRVGARDNFFTLGGHSLLATQVMSRVRATLSVELPLREIFEAPTVAELARVVRAAQQAGPAAAPPLVSVPRQGELPLSFAQQRLWFLDQMEPGSPAYNTPWAVRLAGEVSPWLLAGIFTEVVRRHEVLRTTFSSRDGRPVQVIAPELPLDLPVLDLSDLPEPEREVLSRDLALAEARRPFSLERGPLLRLSLVRLDARDHLLLVTLHHIVGDGWSLGVLLREIAALYETFSPGRPSPLPELPVQYADFAVWQRSWLQGEVLDAQLDFWKQRLAGAPTVLELPLDRPRPAVQTFRGASRPLHLGSGLSEAVRDLSRREGATPFMVLLAAWAVLLGRHAGQEDVLVGAPIAGRNRREIEGLIGFFVNTLVLRSDLSESPSFGELLGRVRRTALDAFTHQDLPFERIVEEVVVKRNLAVSPLFQVLFTLQNAPMGNLSVPGLAFSPISMGTEITKFDLSLTLQESPGGFVGTLEHNADLFDGSTVERLLARFTSLLEAAARDASLPVADLPLLLSWERQQALVEWNDTAAGFPGDYCLHELIAAQARRTPASLALAAGEGGAERLTFATLDAAAERLAVRLRILGVGPEAVVALYLDRSMVLGIAVLAVLKAGGAFLPLDLANPPERLAWVLQDARPLVVLTEGGLAPRLPNELDGADGRGPRVICLDLPAEAEAAALPIALPVSPDNLAYVIYTSGSTGRPKGTMIPHRGVVNYLSWAVGAYRVEAGCGAPVHTSLAFDLTLTSLLAPWLAGRCALLVPEAEGVAALDLALAGPPPGETGFSLVKLTPAHLLLAEQTGAVAAGCTQTLVVGGEALFGKNLEAWRSAAPTTRVVNEYGPTEAVVGCCVYEASVGMLGDGPVPIGRPIANSRLYVVDGQLRPVPLGTPGELLIGGVGLARGYLRRPGLTAERFIPDALGEAPGGRLYRTGDRVRQRPDGILEYLGRVDHQVKIRGFRIELGEIETVLASHPAVRECVLLVREDAPGSRLLVAYVVLNPKSEIQNLNSNLRSFLGKRLPEHMVPSAIVVLDTLPLSSNGKLDRRALPAPEQAAPADGTGSGAPTDSLEELLAATWAELLGLERVGVHDDFFALGGHSLLATRVASRIRSTMGVSMPPRALFEFPTVTELAQAVRALRRKGALLAPPVTPVPRSGSLPLSFAQQRLWLVDQLAPGSPAYNMPWAVRLHGTFPGGVLERVFTEVVRRHETLRTTFVVRQGEPMQVIAPALRPQLPVVDLASLPDGEREALARRLARGEARLPFDLQGGPLLRLTFVRLGKEDHLLLVTMHHIVSDGWSVGVFLREIAALFAAFSQGMPSPLPELPVQYADFAVWQRTWLQGEALEEQLAFWKGQLAEIPRVLELPTDRPRPAVQTFRGATRPLILSPSLSDMVREFCRREGATSFMVLLAAWAVLLGRHAGQDQVPVGTAVAGRNRQEIEGLIGFFVNTLVLPVDLSGSPGFTVLLGRVRQTTLDALAHQDLPFERLVEELVPERDLSHSPLFQALFALQNAPTGSLELPGLSLSTLEVDGGLAKFDLTLTLTETPAGFSGGLQYNTDLFDGSTAARWLARFENLLEAALHDPDLPLPDLPLLLPAERHQALVEWNDAASAYPQEASLSELFAAVAAERPEAPAVVDGAGVWSYRRLDEASNRLARHLQRLGVRPGDAMALSMERSPELVLGTLAILKAGCAYVPLDAGYPDERLDFMLADTGAKLALVNAATRERLTGRVRLMDVDGGDWQGEDANPLETRVPAESLAYLIYTSGSTGRPKGVAVPHRAVVRLVRETHYAQLRPDDRVAHVSNISFDAATFEIWGALLNGGAMVVIPREVALSPRDFVALLRSQGVTALFLTTALFNQVAREVPGAFASLCHVLFGGEAVDPGAVARVLADGPPERLLHVYGPTESTTFATWHRVGEVPPGAVTVPIGLPVAGTSLYVLDSGQRPVPPGATGELLLGGDGLAWGYWNRPEATAERFVPHPWGDGERLYRTGDLVRQRLDGAIEFLGRFDHQVKIRGFRIEPGEIEAVLASHPAVRDCVVLVREDSPGARRLVACIAGALSDPGVLRGFLAERLPDYMLPSAFVLLDALPLTPNGKVDRTALARLAPEPAGSEAGIRDPRTPAEELLAVLWSDLLGVGRVGPDDGFFELGGHSLLAARLASLVRETFGVELPLRAIFEEPTLGGLAARIGELRHAGAAAAPPIRPSTRREAPPLSFSQQRLWFLDCLAPGSAAYNIPLALRISGGLDAPALARSLAEVQRRHEALRTTFAESDGEPVQVVAPEPLAALARVDLRALPWGWREPEARRWISETAGRPFDLARGPLLRAALFELDGADRLLSLDLHHIVSDGWSSGVLVRELTALYEAFRAGRLSPLPELPIQYGDFACWQREWLEGEVLAAELDHWRRLLAGAPAALDLPTDRPRGERPDDRGGRASFALTEELSTSLRALARREAVTPFMLLLTGFAGLLSRWTGQSDTCVGTPIAGRTRLETEGLIGFFVNTLVLRLDLTGDPDTQEALRRMREASLAAFAHPDLPFEKLVEDLAPERSLARSPLFQVTFALQNLPVPEIRLPGITLAPIEADSGAAKFELSLAMVEQRERFAGTLTYAASLFDRPTALRLLAGFERLLGEMAADPTRHLSALSLLGPAERHQLMVEWNDTATDASAVCLHELFERQADRRPEAPALHFEGEFWTYGDVERRANRIAHRLRRAGSGPGVRVAILARRSAERVAWFLGILKSGAASLALDPDHPPARLAQVLDSASPWWILAGDDLRDRLPESFADKVLALDDLDTEPAHRPIRQAGSVDEAYVVFTSGSTGRPKGIMAHHGGAVAYLEWLVRTYGLAESDIALQLAPLTFDASVRDTLGPLAAGGQLILVPDEIARDPAALLARAAEHEITCLPSVVPSLLRRLTQAALEEGRALASLRLILTAGEPLRGSDAADVRRAFGDGVRLANQYGQSETTMTATWHLVWPEDEAAPAIPAGRPIAGMRGHLLDRNLRPVSLGAQGEVCLGGPGLARGYLGQPDRTAETFVPDPFGCGERLYRTGDLGRRQTDGTLEVLGRLDAQVKIRGLRVEPGEAESVLLAHPGVREAAVVVRADASGETRLVAYIVGDAVPDSLRAFLAERLPGYLIPTAWVALDTFPLTPHGKVDRRRLPEPSSECSPGRARVAPRNDWELRLARIWEDILDVRPVGVTDGFFDLGGHSLAAVRLIAAVRRHFGRDLPLWTLFRYATVESLAAILRTSDTALAALPLVPLTPLQVGSDRPPLFCIHGAGGGVLIFADLARGLGEDQPTYAFEARGLDRVEAMAGTYLEAIQTVQPEGPYHLLGYSMGGKVAFEIARRLEREGQQVALLTLIDTPAVPSPAALEAEDRLTVPPEIAGLPDFDVETAERYLAVYRTNREASRTYVPGPYGGRLLLFAAEDGNGRDATDPTLGWGAFAAGGVEVHRVPGGHYTLLGAAYVGAVVNLLRGRLTRAVPA